MTLPLLLTPGEPTGIGPELAVQAAIDKPGLVLVGDPELLVQRSRAFGLELGIRPWLGRECDRVAKSSQPSSSGGKPVVQCLPVKLAAPSVAGKPDPANASYVLETLERATQTILAGQAAGLVTGPVHKGVINESGIAFSGHTEFLADLAGVDQVVMLLVAGKLRVALATTHLPLSQVPAAINAAGLEGTLEILQCDLADRFGIRRARIAVLGLNPHAGEGGHLGREELEIITPIIERMRKRGLSLEGPLPADTAFLPERLEQFDAVLAMYHDQGLPVLKHAGFGCAVNVTLGLPFVRTSVDHGTALDLAGTGQADPGSMNAAIALARSMVDRKSVSSRKRIS